VDVTVTAAVIIKWYCIRAKVDAAETEGRRLQFDGELIEPDTAVKDMEVEDKDLVDVV